MDISYKKYICIVFVLIFAKVSTQRVQESCNSFNQTLDFGFESKLKPDIKNVIWNKIKSDGDASLAKYDVATGEFTYYEAVHPSLKGRLSRVGTSNLMITDVKNVDIGRFTVTISYNNNEPAQESEIKLAVSDICFIEEEGTCTKANCYPGEGGYIKDPNGNKMREDGKFVLSVTICDSTKAGNYSCCSVGTKARCSEKPLSAPPPDSSPSSDNNVIIPVVVAVVVLVLLGAGVAILLYKRKQHEKSKESKRFKGEEAALRSNENHEQPEA